MPPCLRGRRRGLKAPPSGVSIAPARPRHGGKQPLLRTEEDRAVRQVMRQVAGISRHIHKPSRIAIIAADGREHDLAVLVVRREKIVARTDKRATPGDLPQHEDVTGLAFAGAGEGGIGLGRANDEQPVERADQNCASRQFMEMKRIRGRLVRRLRP